MKHAKEQEVFVKKNEKKKMKNKVVSFDASFSRKSSLKNLIRIHVHSQWISEQTGSEWSVDKVPMTSTSNSIFSETRDFKILLYIFDIYFYRIIFRPVSYDPYSIGGDCRRIQRIYERYSFFSLSPLILLFVPR